MPFDKRVADRVLNASGHQFWEEVTIRDGDFTNGNQHNQTIQAGQKGVIGELEIGSDSPVSRALAFQLGDTFDPLSTGQGQTQAGSIDIELKTGGNGDATAGAKVGFGIVDDRDKPLDNAMPVRDEARVDDAVTPREQQKKFWADRGPTSRIGTEGEFLVLVAQAPPGTNEAYGMDHTSVEVEGVMLTSRGLNNYRQARGVL